ncbi:MAG TPA: LSM domain-containing protein [Candidatus Thermoplasmatota archaeon]|jgi:small nuclear ribonucleoprotein (snRNP)-like protein|nr:LSM domain-containing protein [Candidatus Thermoplasmatota archaeon]
MPAAPSVLTKYLKDLVGNEIIVVMDDDRTYKGRLVEFDEAWMFLEGVTEGTTQNLRGWEEAAVSAGIVEKYITMRGIISEEKDRTKVIRLKDVLINIEQVLRIWPLRPEYLAKPEHIHIEGSKTSTTHR